MLADLRARRARRSPRAARPCTARSLRGVVDELFLTITPLVTGDEDEPNIVAGGRLPQAVGLELVSVDRAGSELFLRYGRAS